VRTAVVSDLHLGSATGEDLLRDASLRRILLDEIGDADRVVLLGDAVELRDLPLAEALELSRPFFEDLGAALAGREVVLAPGNHDHRLAEPLLERIALSRKGTLRLEQRFRPAAGAGQRLARWLGEARLELAYPGVWLREDVYATHGHYLDLHLTLPRAECLGAAAVMRGTGPLPDPATPDGYERILRPVYGLTYGLAQSGALRRAGGATRVSERAWHWVSGDSTGSPIRRLAAAATAKAALPAGIWTINRLLGANFDSRLSPRTISRSGVAAAREMVRRLEIGAAHVITGHTHRAGPREGERGWALPGGGSLHNTGNWIFSAALHPPDARPGPYWPGTVTWVEADAPPRRVALLHDWGVERLGAVARGGRFRLASIASHELG
jgi:Calcineurin-like phosphoesterase